MLSDWLEWVPGDQQGSKHYATLEALKRAVSRTELGVTACDLTIILYIILPQLRTRPQQVQTTQLVHQP